MLVTGAAVLYARGELLVTKQLRPYGRYAYGRYLYGRSGVEAWLTASGGLVVRSQAAANIVTGEIALTGLGDLLAGGRPEGRAALAGLGGLSASAIAKHRVGARMAGQGLPTKAECFVKARSSVAVTGLGGLQAAGVRGHVVAGVAQLTGQGAVQASGRVVRAAKAVLAGAGSLQASGAVRPALRAQAALVGLGSLSAAGLVHRLQLGAV